MNILLLSCLLLFVIYFSILGLLVYYFFCERDIWNIFFDEIYQDIEFLVSGCLKYNTQVLGTKDDRYNECTKEDKMCESHLYNVKILYNIYTLFRTLDVNMLEDINISSRCRMFQLLLEYIIRNYKELCNGNYSLYERLQMVYLNKDIVNKNVSSRINNLAMGIEIIPILEEYLKVFEKLDAICRDINIEMVHSTFLIGFYQDFRHLIIDAKKYLSDVID